MKYLFRSLFGRDPSSQDESVWGAEIRRAGYGLVRKELGANEESLRYLMKTHHNKGITEPFLRKWHGEILLNYDPAVESLKALSQAELSFLPSP